MKPDNLVSMFSCPTRKDSFSSTPKKLLMEKLLPRMIRSKVIAMFCTASTCTLLFVMGMGRIRAVIPRMKIALNMFEPTMLPTEMSEMPLTAAEKLTTISGVDVPIPTIVRPIRNSLSPAFLAITVEPSTKKFDPITTIASPTRTRSTRNAIFSRIYLLLGCQSY